MLFEDQYGFNQYIDRIQASAQNNIAHTTKNRPWMWGSQQYSKMGYWYAEKNWEVPKPVIW